MDWYGSGARSGLVLWAMIAVNAGVGLAHETGGQRHEEQAGLLGAYTSGGDAQLVFVVAMIVAVVVAAVWAGWIYLRDDVSEEE